jgi:hypothetical protein
MNEEKESSLDVDPLNHENDEKSKYRESPSIL